MSEELTPEEIARAKRFMDANGVKPMLFGEGGESGTFTCRSEWMLRLIGVWANQDGEAGFTIPFFKSAEDGVRHYALALRPVFNSVGPLIREDFRQSACDALLKEMQAAGLKNDRWDAGYRKACENCAVIVEGLE